MQRPQERASNNSQAKQRGVQDSNNAGTRTLWTGDINATNKAHSELERALAQEANGRWQEEESVSEATMQVKPIKIEKSSATVGYLLLSIISVIIFALAFQDMNMLVFAIPLLVGFVVAASIDRGTPEKDIIAIGYSSGHPEYFIPIGIIGGMIAILLGSLIMEFSSQSTAALIPDFSGLKFASVIPPTVALSANLVAQWLIIAPSEEILARTIAPFAFMSLTKNVIVAYLAGSALWMLTHYPTFSLQNAPNTMYLVLAVLATITLIVYFITKSLFASIISHATFNSGVLIISSFNPLAFYTLSGISAILTFVWLRGRDNVVSTNKGDGSRLRWRKSSQPRELKRK